MPLISAQKDIKKESVTFKISSDILNKVHNYCSWANVTPEIFFEEASKIIFKKDKEYKAHFKTPSNRGRKKKVVS